MSNSLTYDCPVCDNRLFELPARNIFLPLVVH